MVLEEVIRLYKGIGFLDRLCLRLRSKLSPFEDTARHVPLYGNIIDVGCGYGILSNLLANGSKDRNVVGVDLSKRRIRLAKKSIDQRTNIDFQVKDACDLEFKGYKVVIMTELLHHLPLLKQNKLLSNIYHQMDDEAILMILEIDKKPLLNYLLTVGIDIILNVGKPLFYHNKFEFIEMLEKIGFDVEVVRFHSFIFLTEVLFICKKDD